MPISVYKFIFLFWFSRRIYLIYLLGSVSFGTDFVFVCVSFFFFSTLHFRNIYSICYISLSFFVLFKSRKIFDSNKNDQYDSINQLNEIDLKITVKLNSVK